VALHEEAEAVMPAMYPGIVAQRAVYSNGTRSSPFIASMCGADMVRVAQRILEDSLAARVLGPDGKIDWDASDKARAADDFDPGSVRIACAYDGRFWSTLNTWRRQVRSWDWQIGNIAMNERAQRTMVPGDHPTRSLGDGELSILFGLDDEFGWHALGALGIVDPVKALARTVLEMSKHVEEWSEP
jgi:hypothetical protein